MNNPLSYKLRSQKRGALPYECLVLGGAGSKGYAHLGALHRFHQDHLLENVHTFIGTSIGAVLCTLLAIGMTPFDIWTQLVLQKETFFDNITKPNLLELFRNDGRYGLYDLNRFANPLREMIGTHWQKSSTVPTLQTLYEQSGATLVVVVTNSSKQCAEYLDHQTAPSLSIVDACLMSCSIPFLFQRMYWNDSFYIDGGVTDNFALQYAATRMQETQKENRFPQTPRILGICVSSLVHPVRNFVEYVETLALLPSDQLQSYACSLLLPFLDVVNVVVPERISLFQLDLSDDQKKELFRIGFESDVGGSAALERSSIRRCARWARAAEPPTSADKSSSLCADKIRSPLRTSSADIDATIPSGCGSSQIIETSSLTDS